MWSDFTECDELVSWQNAGALGLSDGDAISAWTDASGNGVDLGASGSSRPTYRAAGINGLPSVEFDGVDDVMSSGQFMLDTAVYWVVVLKLDTLKNYHGLLNVHDNSTPTYRAKYATGNLYNNSTRSALCGRQPVSTFSYDHYEPRSPYAVNTPLIISGGHSETARWLSINGHARWPLNVVGSTSDATGNAYLHVGNNDLANAYLDGHLAELVIVGSVANGQIASIEGSLAHKYAIDLTDSHPFAHAAPTHAPGQSVASTVTDFSGGFQ